MTARRNADPFFIGYLNVVPRPLALFLLLVAAGLVGGMAGLALAVGSTVNDPGDGRFAGRGEFVGLLRTDPYPVVHVPASADGPAKAVLLSGPGKRGVQARAEPLDSKMVQVRGAMLKRGSIDMLQVGGGRNALVEAETDSVAAPEVRSLGRWRITGEICDGKCYVGAMRPGRGLAHKACANLCVIGGIPPVFVSSSPIHGQVFFLLADPEGRPLPDGLYDKMALMIEVEGEIEQRDDLFVLKVDLAAAKVL